MKKTTKKVIALTAVLAMAASTSTMAFAANEDVDTGKIQANDTQGGTTVTLDVTSQFESGLYTVQIPATVDLKYDFSDKKWKNTPSNDLVKIADNTDFLLEEGKSINVNLADTTINLNPEGGSGNPVECTCSMDTFTASNADHSGEQQVTFTASSPEVAQKYVGTATFNISIGT